MYLILLLTSSGSPLPFLLFLVFLGLLIYSKFFRSRGGIIDAVFFRRRSFTTAEIEQFRNYLHDHKYYNDLSLKGKVKFFDRLIRFMIDKEFVGMEGLQVTDEMRTRVSACAVQLTFGLDVFILPHFRSIRIFPREFYSRLIERYLKGGTTQSGIIMLSWNNFVEGYEEPADKYNLGLHEMAHALLLDMMHGDVTNVHLEQEIGRWEGAGDVEMEKLKKRQPHFLRAYGATNEHEFFAVSVEHFFETPAEFKKNLPGVYKQLCVLLNQDPLNISGDYKRI